MSHEIEVGQDWLIKKMSDLGMATGNEGGFCFAISHVVMAAWFNNDFEHLSELLRVIHALPQTAFTSPEVLEKEIHNCSEDLDSLKHLNTQQLQKSIRDLFATLSVCQEMRYAKIILPHLTGYDSLQTLEMMSQLFLAAPFYLSRYHTQPSHVSCVVGWYESQSLLQYLDLIEEHFGQLHFTLQLGGQSDAEFYHAICLSYEPENRSWLLSDPNFLPGQILNDKADVAAAIPRAFSCSRKYASRTTPVYMKTTLYVKDTDLALSRVTWQRLTQTESWQHIHRPTTTTQAQFDEEFSKYIRAKDWFRLHSLSHQGYQTPKCVFMQSIAYFNLDDFDEAFIHSVIDCCGILCGEWLLEKTIADTASLFYIFYSEKFLTRVEILNRCGVLLTETSLQLALDAVLNHKVSTDMVAFLLKYGAKPTQQQFDDCLIHENGEALLSLFATQPWISTFIPIATFTMVSRQKLETRETISRQCIYEWFLEARPLTVTTQAHVIPPEEIHTPPMKAARGTVL